MLMHDHRLLFPLYRTNVPMSSMFCQSGACERRADKELSEAKESGQKGAEKRYIPPGRLVGKRDRVTMGWLRGAERNG